MKKTKKVLTILLVLSLIIGSLSFVNATTDKLNISNGTRQGNIVTFTITLPEGGGLNGDANDNGRVDEYKDYEAVNSDGVHRPAHEDYNVDVYLIEGYLAMINSKDELNILLADYNCDGDVTVVDVNRMQEEKELLKNPITLNGTLAESSTYKMSKNSDGTYKVQVTIPSDEDGTIGITVKPRVFKYSSTVANEEISSNLVNVTTQGMNSANLTISNGVKESNKVTFKINLPEDTALTGDVNLDGKLDEEDCTLINKYLLNSIDNSLTEIQLKAADVLIDGEINSSDSALLMNYISGVAKYKPVSLNGTLAESSKYELVKDSSGNYSVVVTIPDGTTEGTIGVTVEAETFMFDLGLPNEAVSSEFFDLSNNGNANNTDELKVIKQKDEKQDDGKIKVTVIVNKELDKDKIPDGWELSEDGKSISKVMDKGKTEEITLVAKDGSTLKYTVIAGDKTTATGTIPQTGVINTMLLVIVGIAIAGTVVFVRSRKMLK